MRSVVVTGVSSGIGWGIAKVLVQQGFRVFGTVRKQQDAERLVNEFGAAFIPLIVDVTDEPGIHAAAQQVREKLQGETLFGLVNNAGISVVAPLLHQTTNEFRRQFDVNLFGVLICVQAFAPLLGADRSLLGEPGRIINMSSGAGKTCGRPFNGPYTASKHALEGFSESLRRELMLYGVDVILMDPCLRYTAIFDKADEVDMSMKYASTDFAEAIGRVQKIMIKKGKMGGPPEPVGEAVLHVLTVKQPKVRYVIHDNFKRRVLRGITEMLVPTRLMDNIIANKLGLNKKVIHRRGSPELETK